MTWRTTRNVDVVHRLVFRKNTEVQKSVSETGLFSVLRFSYRALWTRYFSTFLPVGGKKSVFQNGVFLVPFGTPADGQAQK